METDLSREAIRVLGVLIEKEMSTPEYYPLTLNALRTGCNQKTNRDPVVDYGESDVLKGLDELERLRLVGHVSGAGSRAMKYRHAAREALSLSDPEIVVLSCLLLRGPQTPGELRARTARSYEFESPEDVADVLRTLSERETPLAQELERQPGQKENRHEQLLGAAAQAPVLAHESAVSSESAKFSGGDVKDRLQRLEQDVEVLRREFDRFRSQFE